MMRPSRVVDLASCRCVAGCFAVFVSEIEMRMRACNGVAGLHDGPAL